jgi:Tfp pilus assembly protein FimT
MSSGDMMFVVAVVAAMTVFAVTLFTVTWLTNGRK